jgi:hypothetical protein
MAGDDAKASALAVASVVGPFALAGGLWILLWPDGEPSTVLALAWAAGAVALIWASAKGARRLRSRLWPTAAWQYYRATLWVALLGVLVVMPIAAIDLVTEGRWLSSVFLIVSSLLVSYAFLSRLRNLWKGSR